MSTSNGVSGRTRTGIVFRHGFAIRCIAFLPRSHNGWGGRIRTYGTLDQNQLPYHLATPQYGGECGIRTHGTLSCSTVFKTVALSQTLPTLLYGLGSWIRTNDLLYPKQAHYQAVLYRDIW